MNKIVMLVTMFSVVLSSSAFASMPACKVKKVEHSSAIFECSCKAGEKFVVKEGTAGFSCEAETLSYTPTNCSYNPTTKTVSNCSCDQPLSQEEARSKFYAQNSELPVFSYAYNATSGQCERAEWIHPANLVECDGGVPYYVREVSKKYPVLDSKLNADSGVAIIGSCGDRTNDEIWLKVNSKDRDGVIALFKD